MVKPDRSPAATARAVLLLALAATGCSAVPRSRLDEATKITQALRAENAQLRDRALALRGDNDDLSERAVGDARKIAALEQSVERLESSVQGYIDEREDLVDKYQRFRRLAQSSAASPPSTAMTSRLRSFAASHPGTAFDPGSSALSVEADALFVAGSDRLRPGASRWLDDCAAILAEPEAKGWTPLVAGRAGASTVRLASTAPPATPPADLGLARAVRVRDALAERAGRDPSRIGVAGLGTPRQVAEKAGAGAARIEIALDAEAR